MAKSSTKIIKKDVLIIGAGASGLMCAIEAGKRGRKTLVIDKSEEICKKLKVSGGGRCNFTNLYCGYDNYISENPHFCKSALARFKPLDFIKMLEKHGIKCGEKQNGQMFCRGTAIEISETLQKECVNAGVEIKTGCKVFSVKKDGFFSVETSSGVIISESLVIATGGLSYPELGATDFGYRIAKQFGLKVTKLKPGLVPLVFNKEDRHVFSELSGLSMDATVKCREKSFRGRILFTHKGLSGPAILQISLYWEPGMDIIIRPAPEIDFNEFLLSKQKSRAQIHNILSRYLPLRFAKKWLERFAESRPLCSYSEAEIQTIATKLHNWTIKPAGTYGFEKAEVTRGGVETGEISSKTMEASKISGLYFIGEVLDVTGQLGGYNLQWAWSSGYAAGQYV